MQKKQIIGLGRRRAWEKEKDSSFLSIRKGKLSLSKLLTVSVACLSTRLLANGDNYGDTTFWETFKESLYISS